MASSRKSNLTETVAARLAPLVPPRSHILIALSGGMDSVVLLHLLSTLAPRFGWRLSALHVHHGISRNSDAWADFCAGLCARHNIPLLVERVDIAPLRDDHGIEAAARKLRHAAFARQASDFIALAHHADDQAETLLLQLLRGAGTRGAAAMPVLKPAAGDAAAKLRPLLDVSRGDLLAYAQSHALQWVDDESNANDLYPRNFLRHRVLPLLEQRFPAYRDTLARSALHFAEAGKLLDELALQDGAQALNEGLLQLDALKRLSRPRAKNLLRHFLHAGGAPMPQAVQLDDMLRQLLEARDDAAVCCEFGGWQVRRYQGDVYAFPAAKEFDAGLVVPWSGEAEVQWPALGGVIRFLPAQGRGISLPRLREGKVTLRLRSGGEMLRPHPNVATRSLKNLLQERHIPPWRRERLPLLYCGEQLACVVGVAVAADFQASPSEPGIVVG